ncbi:hypothetical protein J2T07_003574 [Luteibacter jiangsuensis]|uniref:LysB family phage lysis regulatory protein n=1 Tax=Luteibacter jiangsuensis TaxID=637577 RepID=A0ABT9T3D7_9GAMM|nr:hypothetical protein [Luteibacter jiangsuensis]MDQ0011364.1 hypothetical protein [Luteibacter jiangsuensis]
MATHGDKASESGRNGRKIALIVIAVAFIASATTAMLAFTASHRAREADAKALEADGSDLREMIADWRSLLADAEKAAPEDRQPRVDRLITRINALSDWKPRTPCGQETRDRLRGVMEERARRLMRDENGQDAGTPPADEADILASAWRQCMAAGATSE